MPDHMSEPAPLKKALSTTEAEYIAWSKLMRDILPFVSLMKEIEFVLRIQWDAPTVLCSLFGKTVTPVIVYKDNEGSIALTFSLQIKPHTKHISIKYHHF